MFQSQCFSLNTPHHILIVLRRKTITAGEATGKNTFLLATQLAQLHHIAKERSYTISIIVSEQIRLII